MDYIEGLMKLYTAAPVAPKAADDDMDMEEGSKKKLFQKTDGHSKLLTTLQDFASIAKTGRLSNYFLKTFADVVNLKEEGGDMTLVLKSLDVLIAMLEQVKLKKENQVVLMQGIKVFINSFHTKKKAFKLLAKVVEKYELEGGINELNQIHQELTPLVEGHASKPRLRLINAYIQQIKNFVQENQDCGLEQVGALLKHYIIELITAMTNSNLKIRTLAQGVFSDICEIMRVNFNAVNQLFTIILVGLAGNKSGTQSSTIRSLIFTIKQNVNFTRN